MGGRHRKWLAGMGIGVGLLMAGVTTGCSAGGEAQPQAGASVSGSQAETAGTEETAAAALETSAEGGFGSPEDAVKSYLEGLKANDLDRMVDTFKVEGYVVNQAVKGNAGGKEPDMFAWLDENPDMASFYEGIGVANRKSEIMGGILRQYAVLCRMDVNPSGPIRLAGEKEREEFLGQLAERMEATDFGSLELLGFVPPQTLMDTNDWETTQDNQAMIAANRGADEFDNRVAAIELSGNKYLLFFDLACYHGKWFNLETGGILANIMGVDRDAAGTVPLDGEDEDDLSKRLVPEGQLAKAPQGEEAAKAALTAQAEGYDSPQEAAEAYLEGLKSLDLNRMMGAFALESYVDRYDFQEYLSRTQSYLFLHQEFDLPPVNDFVRGINLKRREQGIRESIVQQYTAFVLIHGDYFGNFPITQMNPQSEDFLPQLMEMISKMDFDSLEILGDIPPGVLVDSYDSDNVRELLAERAKVSGADGQESCIIAFQLGGNPYIACFETLEYDGRWYTHELGGTAAILLDVPNMFEGVMPLEDENREAAEAYLNR